MTSQAIINFLHLLAAVTWIGGMIFMNIIFMPSQTVIAPQERGKIVGSVAKRFSILAWLSVVILLITGIIKTPSGMMFNPGSGFGLWLTIKHVIIILMIVIGLYISLGLAPKINKLIPNPGEQPSQVFIKTQNLLKLLGLTNMILGILILVTISMMQFNY